MVTLGLGPLRSRLSSLLYLSPGLAGGEDTRWKESQVGGTWLLTPRVQCHPWPGTPHQALVREERMFWKSEPLEAWDLSRPLKLL